MRNFVYCSLAAILCLTFAIPSYAKGGGSHKGGHSDISIQKTTDQASPKLDSAAKPSGGSRRASGHAGATKATANKAKGQVKGEKALENEGYLKQP